MFKSNFKGISILSISMLIMFLSVSEKSIANNLIYQPSVVDSPNVEKTYQFSEAELNDLQESIKKGVIDELRKKFQIGLSFGPRLLIDNKKYRASGFIEPINNTLQIEYADKVSLYLSTSIVAMPFKEKCCFKKWGFVANLNLLEFGKDENNVSFNKKIDGGLGIIYQISEEISISLTYEKMTKRRLQDWVFQYEDKTMTVEGEVLKSFDVFDDKYYMNSSNDAFGLQFVYFF